MRRPLSLRFSGWHSRTQRLLFGLFGIGSLCCVSSHAVALEDIPFDQIVPQSVIERPASSMAYGHQALWVVSGFELARVDPSTLKESKPDIGAMTSFPAFGIGEDAAWVAHVKSGTLYKLDGLSGEVLLQVPDAASYAQGALAFGDGRVWLLALGENLESARVLLAFDAEIGAVRSRVDLPAQGFDVAFAKGHAWVTSQSRDVLYQVDPATNDVVLTSTLGDGPGPIVSGGGSLWFFNLGDRTVQRVDPKTGLVTATIATPLPHGHVHLVFGDEHLWLAADEK